MRLPTFLLLIHEPQYPNCLHSKIQLAFTPIFNLLSFQYPTCIHSNIQFAFTPISNLFSLQYPICFHSNIQLAFTPITHLLSLQYPTCFLGQQYIWQYAWLAITISENDSFIPTNLTTGHKIVDENINHSSCCNIHDFLEENLISSFSENQCRFSI